MSRFKYLGRVQARDRARINVNALSNTTSTAGHEASRGAVEHLRRHWTAYYHLVEIHPYRPCKADRGLFTSLICDSSLTRAGCLNRADCVKAGCSLICHVGTRSVCPHGSAQRSMEITRNRIAQVGQVADGIRAKAQRMNCRSTRRTSIQTRKRVGPQPKVGRVEQKRQQRTTSRETQIKDQAVQLRARATGRKACLKSRCISSQADAINKPWPGKSMVAACLYEPSSSVSLPSLLRGSVQQIPVQYNLNPLTINQF